MALLATVYTTAAEVDRLFSASGVINYADHDADGSADAEVVNDCINQATEEINLFARQRYTPAVLATSDLVSRWATTLAVRFLCLRRGNTVPDTIEREFIRIADPDVGILNRIMNGRMQLPGLPLREDLRPSFSNLQVDRRYRRSTIRVTPENSTDAPSKLTQDTTRSPGGGQFE